MGANGATVQSWNLGERSFAFGVQVIKLCRRLDQTPGVPRRLSGQLFDAGTSIGANVREGQAGASRKDFICKFGIALKEARETDYWLRLIVAAEILPAPDVADMIREVGELAKIIGRSIVTARRNDPKPKRVR